jgi:Ca-activated chloride channel homolog
MPLFFLDAHTRRTLAIAAVVLSITGLVLADRAGPSRPTADLMIATGSSGEEGNSPTSSPFGSNGASGRLAVSHGRLLAGGMRRMHAEIRVRASEPSALSPVHAPTAMVLVIDTSGSMAGRKIDDARHAALSLLDQMRDDDRVAVVRFASRAEVVVPMTHAGDARARARAQILGLRAEGNTDIANALRAAERELSDRFDGSGRIVLVTDGRDTSGAPRRTASDVARAEARRGFVVSALGIGTDYDDRYLADISDAGRGNYEYLRDSSALARFLDKELSETSRTTVKSLEADLSLSPGARVLDVSGASWDRSLGQGHLSFGSLFAGDERRAIVTLEVETGEPGSSVEIGGTVSWRLVDGTPVRVAITPLRVHATSSQDQVDDARDLSVMASVTSVEASRRETEAAEAFERGDRARALSLNAQTMDDLDKAAKAAPPAARGALEAQKNAYQGHQGVFATAPASPEPAREIGARERKNADRALSY